MSSPKDTEENPKLPAAAQEPQPEVDAPKSPSPSSKSQETPQKEKASHKSSNAAMNSPSFVWVTSPSSTTGTSHQAQLLDVRPEGYLVRWTICNKEELISPDSILEQELPKRQRRKSLPQAQAVQQQNGGEEKESKEQEEKDHDEDYQDESEESKNNSEEESSKPRTESSAAAAAAVKYQKHHPATNSNSKKRTNSTSSNKENTHEKAKHRKVSPPPKTKTTKATATTTSTTTTTTNNAISVKTIEKNSTPVLMSLWRIHRVPKAISEARVAQLLQPYHGNLDGASDLVSNVFLFAYERQSCWQRRNNEENPVWSQSMILQNYSFANVYRSLDRGTCYLRCHLGDLYMKVYHHSNNNNKTAAAANHHHHPPPPYPHTGGGGGHAKKGPKKKLRRREWIQNVLWASYCYRQVNRMEPFLNYGGIPTLQEAPGFLEFVERIQRTESDKASMFFNVATYNTTPTFEEYKFHLQRLQDANGWLLKSIAGRLAQCRTATQCWEQLTKRLPGFCETAHHDHHTDDDDDNNNNNSADNDEHDNSNNNNDDTNYSAEHHHYGNAIAWQVLCDLIESGCLLVRQDDPSAMDLCYFEPKSKRKFHSPRSCLLLLLHTDAGWVYRESGTLATTMLTFCPPMSYTFPSAMLFLYS